MRSRDKKLAELILYVAEQCESHERFGATKLNKILFYADFIRYGRTGESITEQPYMGLQWGPAPRRLVPVRDELIESGELAIRTEAIFDKEQERPIALREADLEQFSAGEKKIVDEVIGALKDASAREASEISHLFAGWKVARDREDIPYDTVFVSNRRLTASERAHATELTAHA